VDIHIHQVPYDSGRRSWRMGNGPEHFLRNGLDAALQSKGHAVKTTLVETEDPFPSEIKTTFELYRGLAGAVRAGCEDGSFPVVLSGNCGAAVGTLAGISGEPVGIVWLDAHGDFNTPETTISGYLDGMGLAVASGLCWQKLARTIPFFQPIPGQNILHVGGSDIETDEIEALNRSGVQLIKAPDIHAGGLERPLSQALETLRFKVRVVYLHLDLDVLDPVKTPANQFPASDGLEVETVRKAIEMIKEQLTIGAVGVASYDPSYDPQGNTLKAGIGLIEAVVG